MAELADDVWLRCSACRKAIGYGRTHWVCSVSTCNRARTLLVFCSVSCWDSHVATLRHRDSWAVEARAPTRAEAAAGRGGAVNEYPDAVPTATRSEAPTQPLGPPSRPAGEDLRGQPRSATAAPAAPIRTIVIPSSASPSPAVSSTFGVPTPVTFSDTFDRDVLIVVSKLKKYIKDRSGMNTSDAIAEGLSEHVRAICDDAIRAAAADNRKTVLERDVPRPRR